MMPHVAQVSRVTCIIFAQEKLLIRKVMSKKWDICDALSRTTLESVLTHFLKVFPKVQPGFSSVRNTEMVVRAHQEHIIYSTQVHESPRIFSEDSQLYRTHRNVRGVFSSTHPIIRKTFS